MSFNQAIRVLFDHGIAEANKSSLVDDLFESTGYSMHACVHSWTIHVLNEEWDDELAKLAVELAGGHIPEPYSDKWWITQRRLLQHVARCSDLISNKKVKIDGI
jgi:hypothetical protein